MSKRPGDDDPRSSERDDPTERASRERGGGYRYSDLARRRYEEIPPSERSAMLDDDPASNLDPTDAEVDAWAARVRERRQAWIDGPTEREKVAWTQRERVRRRGRAGGETSPFGPASQSDPLARRYQREAQLALFGAFDVLNSLPFQLMSRLVRSGRGLEDDLFTTPRRRVLFEEELDY